MKFEKIVIKPRENGYQASITRHIPGAGDNIYKYIFIDPEHVLSFLEKQLEKGK